ncbi:2Fe-2S iron-sulfur cluster-binding protein [Vibrio sp. RC27]
MMWSQSVPLEFHCSDVWQETPDSVSFELQTTESPEPIDFKPGQFASLGFEINGQYHYRAYSISSLPRSGSLCFTVKRVENGLVSNHIVDTLSATAEVKVLAPQGQFNSHDCLHGNKVVLISAGCGITPVMSMAKQWLLDGNVDIEFIHIARNPENTIYFEELQMLAATHDQFKLKLLLKEENELGFSVGRLSREWLESLCPDIASRSVFTCGPATFMNDVEQYSSELGVDMSMFYQESFNQPEQSDESGDASGESFSLNVPGFGIEAEIEAGATLADKLEESGLPIIIACRSGMCGSCKCKVVSGDIERRSRETLSDEDIENGYVLACSTTVHSDVEVEIG